MDLKALSFLTFDFLSDPNIFLKESGIGLKSNGFSSGLLSIVILPFLVRILNTLTAEKAVLVLYF